MRKLASIRTVCDIQPIPGADNIEMIQVDGWKLVSRKGEFSVGDRCVYYEIDSLLPVCEKYEFLRNSSFKKMFDGSEGFKLKNMRFKGQLSQGLALSVPPELSHMSVGDEVTELLGVKKWEAPIPSCMTGVTKGSFPDFISMTDEERVQNMDVSKLHGEWEVTEKLDGTSCTVYWNEGQIGVCGRNIEFECNEDHVFWKATRTVRNRMQLASTNFPYAIQGEIIGPNVQGNSYKLKDAEFKIFNVYDITNQKYLSPWDRVELLEAIGLGESIHQVPFLGMFIIDESTTVDSLLELAECRSALFTNQREGIVLKRGQGSFKVVSNKFLDKQKD